MKVARVLLVCLMVGVSGVSLAQRYRYAPLYSRGYSSSLSVELDPVAFLLDGYSVHLRYRPMFSERFLLGVGAYAMDLPEVLVDVNSANRDRGWNARIRSAYTLHAELYAREVNAGWFIGEQVGFQNFRISNHRENGGHADFSAFIAMTYGGYSWSPRNRLLYVKPWIGLGFTDKIDGISHIGSSRYKVGLLFPMAALHVGYTF